MWLQKVAVHVLQAAASRNIFHSQYLIPCIKNSLVRLDHALWKNPLVSQFFGVVVASASKEVAQAVRLALLYTTVGFPHAVNFKRFPYNCWWLCSLNFTNSNIFDLGWAVKLISGEFVLDWIHQTTGIIISCAKIGYWVALERDEAAMFWCWMCLLYIPLTSCKNTSTAY